MKQTIMDMESQIVEYARKLDSVQRELQEGVNQFSCEKLLLKSQIEELETQIEDYELNMILKDENNKVLLESLESEKLSRSRVERALESITTSDERLKEMLAQARHTIKCITQKLEEYDIERLEVQKDNQMKISELREQLMIANAIITKLRENLDQMKRVMDKNVALRTLSAQLHESAKIQVTELQDANEDLSKKSQQLTEMYDHLKQVLYEKDKTFEDLRNQLLGLRQQLDDEQKLRENTETILADVKAAGDSELSELRNVIDLSNAEINRLHQEMDSLMKTSTAGRLKMQIEQLDNENAYLKEEIQKLTGCLEKILPGYVDPAELAKLRKQVSDLNSELERQKCEVESEKKMREDMGTMLHSKINQEKESDLRIRELIMENLSLKRSRVKSPSQQAVIFLEKQPKGQYRCLYGMKGGKATPKAVPRVKKSEKATEVPRFEELEKPKGLKRRKKLKEVPRVEKVEKSTEAPNFDKIEKPKMVARLEKPKEVPRVEKIEQPKEVPRPVEREKPQESAALKEIIIANNAELSELKRQNKNLKDEIVNLKRKEAVKPVVFKEDESFAKERDKLSGQINAQKQEIADLLDKINRTPDVNETLKELQHKKEENAKLKSIIADMDDKLKNLPQFHFDTPAGAPEVDKAIVQLRKSLEWEQGRVRQLEEYWRTSENNNESLAKKNVDLEGQIAKVKNALTKLQGWWFYGTNCRVFFEFFR
jgi:chromosome segregation ATPase